MKTLTILSLAAALTGIATAETPAATTLPTAVPAAQPTATPAPSEKPAATKEEAETLMKEMLVNLDELTKDLEAVTDKASADAVVPKLVEKSAKIKELQLRSEKMGEPSPAIQEELMKQYEKPLQETVGKFMTASMKVGMANFYGSETLSEAFQKLGESMSGDQEEETSEAPETK